MTDNQKSGVDHEFYRQQRVEKLMGIEEELAFKKGTETYHQYLNGHEKRKTELNKSKYTGSKLHDMIENTKSKLEELSLRESAERTEGLYRDGVLRSRNQNSARER